MRTRTVVAVAVGLLVALTVCGPKTAPPESGGRPALEPPAEPPVVPPPAWTEALDIQPAPPPGFDAAGDSLPPGAVARLGTARLRHPGTVRNVAFSPDGSRLAVTDDRVLACSNERSGFVAGASSDDGRTFTPILRLAGLRGPLACAPGTSTADECNKGWPRLRSELGITPDAGGPPAPPAAPPASDSGGCGTAGPVSGAAGACVLVALGAFVARRRRRARP